MGEDCASIALRRSAREPEAFARFYDEHAGSLVTYFARRVYDADTAIDLTAEVFAQAYAARHRYRGSTDASAAAWLFTIAKRQLSRYNRKGVVEARTLSRLGMQRPALDNEQEARIDELADLAGLRQVVRTELSRLSVRNREALQLRVIDELPYSTVACRLGVSEQTARARVSRGLRTMAEALDATPSETEGHYS